ncbi:hypothetical protein ACFOEW_06535 [Alteromonas oceani]|uniref:Carboxypeptidase regulatory-like domain-containing protein n=1 Tax=Alteromonas oceani TaxID=2071609 RepID=A0ABV7JWH3_9ALTE|nr:hypothetical protein [Alteromonas oceani]
MKYPQITCASLKGIALLTALSLTACGGSDSDSPEPEPNPNPGGTTTYNVSGTIDNLKRGDLTVSGTASGSTESHTFTNETSFSFDADYPAGTEVTFEITQQPTGQECALSQTSLTLNSDVTDLAITCDDIEYSVSGTVTGDAPADFSLIVSGDRDITVPLSGTDPFTIAEDFIYEQSVALAIGDTPGYECEVTPAEVTVTAEVSDIAVSCTSIGSVSGLVTNFISGEVASDVTITTYSLSDTGETEFGSVTTDENGLYEMIGVDTTDTFYLRVSSTEYVVDVERHIANGETERVLNLNILPIDYSTTFAATDAINIGESAEATVNIVEIPASTLETADGSAPTGDITATITVIDPSLYVEAMPGLYTTSNSETGDIEPIESFGAFSLTLTDADGNDLDLVDGTTATVRIPLASGVANPPATIPLYYFDESTALWVEEGEATLTVIDGASFYVGTVSHFTTWNADQVYNTVELLGCVVDTEGLPVANVQVLSEGTSYIGRSSAYTDAEGDFVLPVRRDSSLLVFARAGGQTNTVVINTSDVDSQLENCLVIGESSAIVKLTWGANPRDLDTHLTGPQEGTDTRFRVYYGNQDETIENVTINLDVDDTSSYGPEVLTIPSFVLPGRYRYGVHHYSGSGTIFSSPTRVELRLNDRTYVFNPAEDVDSASTSYRMWVVFDLIVDDEFNVEVMEINQHTTYSGAETLGVEAFGGGKFSAEAAQPLPEKQY